MSDLLPSNATAQERAISLAVARAAAVPVPFPALWNPQTCPVDLLPWLAWSLSVETWSPTWTAVQKRAVIDSAVEVAKLKGTTWAVKSSLSALGASSAIVEWHQKTPRGTPHTFEINLVGSNTSLAMQDAMVSEIERTKPLRSHYTVLFGVAIDGGINIAPIFRPGVFTRMDAGMSAPLGDIPTPPVKPLTMAGANLTLDAQNLTMQ